MLRSVVVEHLQRGGQRVERASQAVLAVGEDAREAVQPVEGGDDVAGLLVERRGQLGQSRKQVGELTGPAGDGGVELVGDVLQRTEIALVDDDAERRQHLFGGGIAAGPGQRDVRALAELALPRLVHRR